MENEIDLNLHENEGTEKIMNDVEVVLKFMKHIVSGLIWVGILFLLTGLLIFIFKDLLAILVAASLITVSVVCFVGAKKINKFTSFKIKL
jgi:hypothetical protein